MKKILFIHHWSSVGGSGISLYNTWRALEKKYDIVTYIPQNPPDLYNFLISKGLNPKTYNFACGQIPYYSGGSSFYKPGFWNLLFKATRQLTYWKKIIEKESPDIIMVNSKVLCWMSPLFRGRKSVCFVRETIKGSSRNPLNYILKMFLEQFSAVSFLSEYDMNQTNLMKAESVVSPDMLDPVEYIDKYGKEKACEILNIDSSAFNIAFVGGIDKLKGVDVAVKAMKKLKGQNIKLIIAGNDIGDVKCNNEKNILRKINNRRMISYSKKIKLFIKNNKLEDTIEFIGIQTDISKVYSASDLLIFPMKKPHQARPAFEIGVQNKAVIISDFPNIKEFVRDGENGVVFQPNKHEDLAKKILEVSSNIEQLKKMGKSNYEYTILYHTEDYAMKQLINIIDKL